MTSDCPLCAPGRCKAYPRIWENLRRPDGHLWHKIHASLNGLRDESGSPLVPLAESLPLLEQIRSCPHRSRDAGCGCAGMRCALGKGRAGIVNFQDCSACIRDGLAVDIPGESTSTTKA